MDQRPRSLPVAVRSACARLALEVVNSLWPVENRGTRLFIEAFPAHAAGGHYGALWLATHNLFKSESLPPSIYGAFALSPAARGQSAGG